MRSLGVFFRAALLVCALSLAHQPIHAADEQPPATCGNGHLDAGETCADCRADCTVRACSPTKTTRSFAVTFEAPFGSQVSSATVLIGYDSSRVALPGSAGAESARGRLADTQSNAIVVTNDLDYAVRAVFTRPGGIENGRLFTVAFDQCQGTPSATARELGCAVEGCASAAGKVSGCTCSIGAP